MNLTILFLFGWLPIALLLPVNGTVLFCVYRNGKDVVNNSAILAMLLSTSSAVSLYLRF